jgi:hypothetical protein
VTFETTAYAINGSQLGAALMRRAAYAALHGQQGVVHSGDLKVTQLAVPGVGVQIAAGVGLVLNDYQVDPNETYVVSNPAIHIVPSTDMPAANPSAKSYILAVVVGDPDFSQTGHPWMTSDDPPVGQELTFAYVRATLVEVAAGATGLNVSYPALPLARIDVPANTTTITNSMIHDLRTLGSPRQSQEIFVSAAGTWNNDTPTKIPSGSTFGDWGSAQFAPSVVVPTWATRAILVCSVNGVGLRDASVNITGNLRAQLGSVSGPSVSFDLPSGRVGAQRENFQAAGEYDVSSIAGTTAILRVEAFENNPAAPTDNQKLDLRNGSQQIFDVRFFEA